MGAFVSVNVQGLCFFKQLDQFYLKLTATQLIGSFHLLQPAMAGKPDAVGLAIR
jgi:hypothetical protein